MTQASTRHFLKYNPARAIEADGKVFQFEICDFQAGAWRGVYKDADGSMPDSAIFSQENKSGKALPITEADYLKLLEKKRPSIGTTIPVDSYKAPSDPAAASAAPEADGHEEVDPGKVEELIGVDDPTEQSVVTSYKALSEVTGVTVERLQDLNKREDSPVRSTKGYRVSEWKEYLALIEEPTE